ncbi:hypothetical protein [Modicisalibacter sp. MOD 31.J]|uniref:hypothetical protein n=1 Tax=Modicisalibacter sp. MOD 31.J TaxID=2831897 RepID=UPI001CD03C05|nr:hypothetical protein [Modicisalibacter sp. MOD 31.J]MBZ9574397.1 hypothetical protein [Modicisalibacter sp. MOD 31.J]
MKRITIAVTSMLVVLLSGCGKDPISMSEAQAIAAQSDDAGRYQNEFAKAIQQLSTKDDCQTEVMRDFGGFSRVTGDNFYFIYCGKPMNAARRWYYSPFSEKLSRIKAEM